MGNTTSTPKHLQRSDKTKSVIFTFEDYTTNAPDDEKIGREVGALQLAISDHVRDYYHERQIQRSPEDIEKVLLKERQRFPTLPIIEVAHLLCDVRTRRSALNFFISHMVLKNISFFGHKSHTLLSPGAVGVGSDIYPCIFAVWRHNRGTYVPNVRPYFGKIWALTLLKCINDFGFGDPQVKLTDGT